jgi:hypothetical protein
MQAALLGESIEIGVDYSDLRRGGYGSLVAQSRGYTSSFIRRAAASMGRSYVASATDCP